jgi:hypothetical protein
MHAVSLTYPDIVFLYYSMYVSKYLYFLFYCHTTSELLIDSLKGGIWASLRPVVRVGKGVTLHAL